MPKLTSTAAVAGFLVGCVIRISARSQAPALLQGTPSVVFSTIQGNALTSADGQLPFPTVRLRDARSGRIVNVTTADKAGLFVFRGLDPGGYIVELMGPNQTVLGASQILYVNAGETVSAVVKLPFRTPPFGGVLGHTIPSALAVTAAAAASGILATTVTGQPVSPVQ